MTPAAKFPLPFGKWRGVPLEAVLEADAPYLDYMRRTVKLRPGPFKDAFDEFMADKTVQTTIEHRMLDAKCARQNWER